MLNRNIFDLGIKDLKEAFKHIDSSITIINEDIWFKYLQDLSDNQFKKAIIHCIKKSNKIPCISDLRKCGACSHQCFSEDIE